MYPTNQLQIPIAESHQRLFVVNPAESFNWMAYIEPLLWESWGGVLIGILLLPPIIAAYMSYGKEPNRDEFTLSKCYCLYSMYQILSVVFCKLETLGKKLRH